MLTRENYKQVVIDLFDLKEIEDKVHNFEYVQISMSSYGQTWIDGFMNDLPHDYDEIISDGTTYFLDVAEVYEVLTKEL